MRSGGYAIGEELPLRVRRGGLADERCCLRGVVRLELGGTCFQLSCRRAARPKRRVDAEQELIGDGGELGGPLEAVGELRAPRRTGDLGL